MRFLSFSHTFPYNSGKGEVPMTTLETQRSPNKAQTNDTTFDPIGGCGGAGEMHLIG